MSFGYERQPNVMLHDSAVLNGYIYTADGLNLIPATDIASVVVTLVKPNGDPNAPDLNAVAGQVGTDDGHGFYVVDPSLTDVAGEYKAIMTFTYDDGAITGLTKSTVVDFTVSDPFVRSGAQPYDPAVDSAWLMLEDCFDSEYGGPWLRDMTLAIFDKTKISAFVPQVIMNINETMPFSDFTADSFPYGLGSSTPLVAQGLLCASVRHLMRSYTEQPDVVSSPVAFMDRKKYQQAWKAIYDVEQPLFDKWVKQYKLRGYDITHAAVLLGTKAGRMLPAPMRSRNVGRGF